MDRMHDSSTVGIVVTYVEGNTVGLTFGWSDQ